MNAIIKTSIIVLTLLFQFYSPAFAEDISDCDKILIQDTYNSNESFKVNWRLASLIKEKSYKEISNNISTDATIYGIPIHGGFSDLQTDISEKKNSLHESFSSEQLRSILWTGLSNNGLEAYRICVQSISTINEGIYLLIKSLTSNDVAIYLKWNPGQYGPDTVELEWDSKNMIDKLPIQVSQSENGVPIIFNRLDNEDQHLAVKIKIGGKIKGGTDIVIPAVNRPIQSVFECSKINQMNNKCLRCDFPIHALSPSFTQSFRRACINMPDNSKVAMSFQGKISQAKRPGEECQFIAEFEDPDKNLSVLNEPNIGSQQAQSCTLHVDHRSEQFIKVDNTNLVNSSVRLHFCGGSRDHYPCVLSGTMSIFTPEAQP